MDPDVVGMDPDTACTNLEVQRRVGARGARRGGRWGRATWRRPIGHSGRGRKGVRGEGALPCCVLAGAGHVSGSHSPVSA